MKVCPKWSSSSTYVSYELKGYVSLQSACSLATGLGRSDGILS